MYRLILWASVITLPFNIHSQEDSNGNSSRFKIGIRAGAGVDHRFIIQDSTNKPIYDTIFDFFKEQELPAMGFHSGIHCLYNVNEKWVITAAVQYNQHRYRTSRMNLTDVSGNDAGDIWFSYTQRTVGLSAGVQRTLLQKSRYRIFLGAEMMPSYILGLWSTSHIESSDPAFDNMDNTNKENNEAFRKFNVAGLLNPGIELNINQITFQTALYFRSDILKYAMDTPINRRLWSSGLTFSVLYNI